MEELGGRLAVRSSAVDEDAGSQSMAGLYASVLDVQSLEALEKAVLKCLASSMTYGVYQETQAFGQGIGVIIQRFVPFQWGGVAFSRDPLTGDANTVVLNYGRGPIENIASGRGDNAFLKIDKITKTPETVTTGTGAKIGLVDRTCEAAKLGRAAKTNQIAGTHKMDRADNVDGTKKIAKTDKVDPDGAHPDGPCLPTDTVRALVDYLCRTEKSWGCPVDMEWGIENGKLWVVQARPISNAVEDTRSAGATPGDDTRASGPTGSANEDAWSIGANQLVETRFHGQVLSKGSAEGTICVLENTGVLDSLFRDPHQDIDIIPRDSFIEITDSELCRKLVTETLGGLERPIVVADYPGRTFAVLTPYVSGFIFQRGALLAHLPIILREKRIPAVVFPNAKEVFRTGDRVRLVDGKVSSVRRKPDGGSDGGSGFDNPPEAAGRA